MLILWDKLRGGFCTIILIYIYIYISSVLAISASTWTPPSENELSPSLLSFLRSLEGISVLDVRITLVSKGNGRIQIAMWCSSVTVAHFKKNMFSPKTQVWLWKESDMVGNLVEVPQDVRQCWDTPWLYFSYYEKKWSHGKVRELWYGNFGSEQARSIPYPRDWIASINHKQYD